MGLSETENKTLNKQLFMQHTAKIVVCCFFIKGIDWWWLIVVGLGTFAFGIVFGVAIKRSGKK